MALIVILVFLGVFGVIAVVAIASGSSAERNAKMALARLDTALASTGAKAEMSELIVDVRKSELMSTIPWLDRWLTKLELAPRMRRLLYQADLKWTVGGLMLMCGGAFIVPAYLIWLRTHALLLDWHCPRCHFSWWCKSGPAEWVNLNRVCLKPSIWS
jgi:tight adherence protein B